MLCKSFLEQSSELYIHPDGAYRSAILAVNKAQEYKEMVLGFKKVNQQDARAEDLNELINKNPNDYTEIEFSLMDNDSLRSRKIGEIGTIKGACNNIAINDNTIYEYTREGADIKNMLHIATLASYALFMLIRFCLEQQLGFLMLFSK
jgi:hypothetical protein